MKCTCGHDEGQHQEMNGELACFVILNTDGNFNDYCQCMKYEPNVDKDAQLAALREAGEKMAEMLKFLQLQNDAAHLESAGLWSVNGETEIQVAEAREAWEAANK